MRELEKQINFLIQRWCDARTLEPLRLLLNARASLNGLTDGWEAFRFEMKTIRASHSSELTEEELDAVIELLHLAETALDR